MRALLLSDDGKLGSELANSLNGQGGGTVLGEADSMVLQQRSLEDIVLLDISGMKSDGFLLCQNIRSASNVPIIMLSESKDEFDLVLGLKVCADGFDLLALLASDSRHIFSREQIMSEVWGYSSSGDTRTLDVHMVNLRRKLRGRVRIATIRGTCFRLISSEYSLAFCDPGINVHHRLESVLIEVVFVDLTVGRASRNLQFPQGLIASPADYRTFTWRP